MFPCTCFEITAQIPSLIFKTIQQKVLLFHCIFSIEYTDDTDSHTENNLFYFNDRDLLCVPAYVLGNCVTHVK